MIQYGNPIVLIISPESWNTSSTKEEALKDAIAAHRQEIFYDHFGRQWPDNLTDDDIEIDYKELEEEYCYQLTAYLSEAFIAAYHLCYTDFMDEIDYSIAMEFEDEKEESKY